MKSPWLDIPLADYEAHMALPQVGQAQLLSDVFAAALARHKPRSVAVLGCAGGNGFDRISVQQTERVVGVDINAQYIDQVRGRFAGHFKTLELFVGDLERAEFAFAPVALLFAGLVFEYVDVDSVLWRIGSMLEPAGVLVSVIQLPSDTVSEVTPTKQVAGFFTSKRSSADSQLSEGAVRAADVLECLGPEHRLAKQRSACETAWS
jgi:trans-aconitate methyltransferase